MPDLVGRSVQRLSIILLCLFLTACGENSLSSAAQTSLYTDDTQSRAFDQEIYFGLMCVRAGVPISVGASKARCDDFRVGPDEWQRVVLAGLNDIDDRCEQYLSSLYQAKRDRDSYLALLRNTASTTALVLTATGVPETASGALAISIVEAAFGLGEHSLDNYYSRLILEVEGGSIQQLVLQRQIEYRAHLRSDYMRYVTNRATAYYAIRGYLRICLPPNIEGAIISSIHDLTYQLGDSPSTIQLSAGGGARRTRRIGTRNDPDLERLRVFQP